MLCESSTHSGLGMSLGHSGLTLHRIAAQLREFGGEELKGRGECRVRLVGTVGMQHVLALIAGWIDVHSPGFIRAFLSSSSGLRHVFLLSILPLLTLVQ